MPWPTKSILNNAWHWKTLLLGGVIYCFLSILHYLWIFTWTPIGGCVVDCDVYRKEGITCVNECPLDINNTVILVVFVVVSYVLALALVEWRSRINATSLPKTPKL